MHTTTAKAFDELTAVLQSKFATKAVVDSFRAKFAEQIPTHKPWQFVAADGIFRFVREDTREVRDFRIEGPKVIGL